MDVQQMLHADHRPEHRENEFRGDMQRCRLGLRGDFEVLIGSDPSCNVCVAHAPGVAPRHAALRRVGDRIFVRDNGSPEGTRLNGERLRPGTWAELCPQDELAICGVPIQLSEELYRGRERLGIEASPLTYALPRSGRLLCQEVPLRARHGTLTAIMGPCGSGKTTLLNLLNGSLRPTEGRVVLGRRYDVHAEPAAVQELLGHVPPEDIMTPELTVREALECRLRLRFPDMARAIRQRVIRDTCARLGFEESRADQFLDTRIGSAEAGCRGLSGGERKLANIAHELVVKPLVLLLDEPTSGLSSTDAQPIVRLLHDLARRENLTIVLTVHQPSREAFELFDDLLVLGPHGRPAYYGLARDAAPHFEALTGVDCGDRNPAEYLLWIIENTHAGAATSAGDLLAEAPPIRASAAESHAARRTSLAILLHQCWVLLLRNLRVHWADRANLALLFGQVPIIVALMLATFAGFAQDVRRDDHFARTSHYFGLAAQPFLTAGDTVPVDTLWREAEEKARADTQLVGQRHAHKRGGIYFLLVASSIWFGLIGACKEVVTEQHIVRRESRSGVHLLSYLGAKSATMALLVGVQTGLLAAGVAPALLGATASATLLLWGVLWLAAGAAGALGLLVSCAARSHRLALTAVPLILVPQLLLGGMLRPPADFDRPRPMLRALNDATLQRWAFEASLATDAYARGGVLRQVLAERLDVSRRYAEFDLLTFVNTPLAGVFFPRRATGTVAVAVACLVAEAGVFLGAAYAVLRWRFARGSNARGKEVTG